MEEIKCHKEIDWNVPRDIQRLYMALLISRDIIVVRMS